MINRRELLVSGAAAGALLLSGCRTGHSQWSFLREGEANTLAVLCDQIIPADDYPSASQADVLVFIDRQLMRHYRRFQQPYRRGLARVEQRSRERFGVSAASATGPQQLEIALAVEREDPQFFEMVRRHTFQGYYGSPRHGGNREAVSWKMLGLAEPPLRGRAQYDLGKRTQP